ncbi:MAG: hypothetical protein ACI4DY_05415 [Monoglobaceae bacterium]
MKDKKNLGIIIAIVLVIGIFGTVGATEWLKNTGGIESNNAVEESEISEYETEDMERRELIESVLNTDDNLAGASKYDLMLAALDATIDNPIDFNNIVYNYEYLRVAYKLNDAQLNYIADLIIDGKEAITVMDLCYFWLDTNEDISIVGDMYGLRSRYRGGTWIENAFNKVTGDKCGVLTEEDVEQYLSEGITVQDIMTANKLCRRGVMTIQEILEMRKDNKTFAEISAVIDGVSVDGLVGDTAQTFAINSRGQSASKYTLNKQNATNVDSNVEENTEPIDSDEVTEIRTLARISGDSMEEYYQKAAEGESICEILETEEESISDEINTDMRNRGIYKTVTKEDRRAYEEREEMSHE